MKKIVLLRHGESLWNMENRGIFLPVFQMSQVRDIWGRI